ncbi:TetR/AcrR family transcriptional regulator [Corynebacterium variabile]|uniref:TetR/AcrR family transcriptional regulator n=1 Tax=Corynebacterium variabile TaxID=1727 RepID=UPI002649CF33|nr:TetR/AcrR family transcriptional regulator [Corynebacterium variabile]MDN6241544.1 TetR/AcrR family transcriptional regulator [Corynebacterium variabile]MDN6677913.1 TetR/AcrR family transcriptional regulator [Corynebacterium variabile]MDN6845073.1 TetR/AcrR family transcriptional regulator [Corynebacterium variabile]
MNETVSTGTREKLITAAAAMIARAPGEDFSLRHVCDVVGVKLPTAYHFFGSKNGLVEAVVEYGFDLYLGQKSAMEHTGDPVQDIRAGWDAHVAFGLANPGLYALMYGTVRPGYAPAAQSRPGEILLSLTTAAAEQGRLVVTPEQATAHILATNIGVTLRQIILDAADPGLSAAVREGVVRAITGTGREGDDLAAMTVAEKAAANPEILGAAETRLFLQWLKKLNSPEA